MWPREEHWPKGSGWLSLARLLGLAVEEESVFKFQVTVSVAPRPEDSEAKLERAVCAPGVHKGGVHMWTWLVRDGKEKLMGLVLDTLQGTKRDDFSSRHNVRLPRGECQRK